MSLIFATQVTASATLELAILALFTAIFAGLAFGTQYRQLQDQLRESKRQADERRRAQAQQVYMWEVRRIHHAIGKPAEEIITAYVRNTSQQPIYHLRFGWGAVGGDRRETLRAEPLRPEAQDMDFAPVPKGPGWSTFGAVVTFRDRAGAWWRIRPDGHLDKVPEQLEVVPPSMGDPPPLGTAPDREEQPS